jgi:hypothetical protein
MNISKSIVAAAAVLAATPASAADTVTYTQYATNPFSQTFTYTMPYAGYLDVVASSLQGTIKGVLNPASNIDFTAAYLTINGVQYNLSTVSSGRLEWRELTSLALLKGASVALTVSGTAGKSAAYTVSFASVSGSVPEASTWIMMILGFGVTAYAMRKRQAGAKVLAAA